MRRTGVIFLLLLVGYTQWGYQLQSIIEQVQIKEAAREAWIASLPDDAFLRLSLADVNTHGRWEEAGKECWYKGHLYDVIRQRTLCDTAWLFCADDEREENLIHTSIGVTKASQDQPARQTGVPTISPGVGDLYCEMPVWIIESFPVVFVQFHPVAARRLPSRSCDILIPPPKYPSLQFG